HIALPEIDPNKKTPATLSSKIVTDILRKDLGFEGLVFTDALNMQGVAKYYEPGDVDLKAFQAGCDVLLFSQDVPTAITTIKKAPENGEISEKDIDKSVRKILAAKYNAGLNHVKRIETQHLTADLNQYTEIVKTNTA